MENAPDEEPTEFLEQVGDIVDNVEQVAEEEMVEVEHEEVLEEIVHGDDVMYDSEGRLIEYQNVVVYEDGSEVIEEYVEVEDMGNGEYAYVMTDEHGHRRLLKPEEVEAVKKEMPVLMEEEELVDQKPIRADEAGPSTSGSYGGKRGKQSEKAGRSATMREILSKQADHMMYMDARGGYYHENATKRLTEMAKVDVEKYVPTSTVNRRPLPDNADFTKPKAPRRKTAPWQDDVAPRASGSSSAGRSPSPLKDALFPAESEDLVVRFKCPECGDGFPVMDKLCEHLCKNHDCQTQVREVEVFNEREFENFLTKIERGVNNGMKEVRSEIVRKKSRAGSSQIFVCNYMNRRGRSAEMVEIGMPTLVDHPLEFCSCFVQKVHSYECIRIKYCDQHIHHDGTLGFRVPISVKRRIFELAFKRMPIPCIQVMLSHEVVSLLPHPSRFEEKLKNFSHLELIELMGIINGSLRKYNDGEPIMGKTKKCGIKFETVQSPQGQPCLVIRRVPLFKKKSPPVNNFMTPNEPSTSQSHQSQTFTLDGENVPMMAREEEVLEEEEDEEQEMAHISEDIDGLMEESQVYDPASNREPMFEELSEMELGVLEAYERDIRIELSEEQTKERIRQKAKYSLNRILALYQQLDAATHGQTATEMHNESIGELREMASFVVEIACQLDAEVKAQFNTELDVDEIKRDMIAGIAMQERVCNPERRRRSGHVSTSAGPSPQKYTPHARSSVARTHEEYTQRIFSKTKPIPPVARDFEVPPESRNLELLRHRQQGLVEEQKPQLPELPEGFKAMPWSKPTRRRQTTVDPNAPTKKRGRPNKKGETPAPRPESSNALDPDESVPPIIPLVAPQSSSSQESSGAIELLAPDAVEHEEVVEQEDTVARAPEVNIAGISEKIKKEDEELPRKTKKNEASEVVKAPSTSEELAEPSPTQTTPAPATKTRTGRVVKPKKWGDE
ncbi:unnamed protein product [Caenorhabditis sp. 36 PRJEB53466]|nr:unnamed protein product [Caenorhabditis sp. 36 PRJEB53466]